MYEPGHAFYEKVQNSKNTLLVRDDVGRSKVCVRDLPPQDFIYGKKATGDSEAAGAVINKWVEHRGSQALSPDRDFRKMNKLAVSNKCTSPKQIMEFRKSNDIRIQEARVKSDKSHVNPDKEFKYGIPTKPSTPLQKVMSFEYAREAAEETNQKYSVETLEIPKPSKAFSKSKASNSKESGQISQEIFKLSKFKKVSAKTDTYVRRVPTAIKRPKDSDK